MGFSPKLTEKDMGSLANGRARWGWTPFRLPSVDAGEVPHLLLLADCMRLEVRRTYGMGKYKYIQTYVASTVVTGGS